MLHGMVYQLWKVTIFEAAFHFDRFFGRSLARHAAPRRTCDGDLPQRPCLGSGAPWVGFAMTPGGGSALQVGGRWPPAGAVHGDDDDDKDDAAAATAAAAAAAAVPPSPPRLLNAAVRTRTAPA